MFTTVAEMKDFIVWAREQGIAQFDVVGVKVIFTPEALLPRSEEALVIPSPPAVGDPTKPLPTPAKKFGSYQDVAEDELFLSAEGGK